MNPLEIFRSGLDYVEIGLALGIHESEVEKTIHQLRKQERLESYQREYREANPERIAAHRKRHNAIIRADLRDIRKRSRA
jgi:hypothetical protein